MQLNSGPYVIGMSNDLSGPIAPLGQQGLAGMKTYIDYLNANGGVNGRKINLIGLDDQSNPALGRSDYQELADKKALVMFGCVYTAVCQAAAPLVSQYKVPIVSEGGPDNDLFPAKPYLYSNDLPQGLQPVVMVSEVAALAKAAHITKVRLAWIGANTAADLDGVTTLKKLVKAHPGWSLVGVQVLPLAVTNATSQAQALAADKPNFIIGVHNDRHRPHCAGSAGSGRDGSGDQRHGRLLRRDLPDAEGKLLCLADLREPDPDRHPGSRRHAAARE